MPIHRIAFSCVAVGLLLAGSYLARNLLLVSPAEAIHTPALTTGKRGAASAVQERKKVSPIPPGRLSAAKEYARAGRQAVDVTRPRFAQTPTEDYAATPEEQFAAKQALISDLFDAITDPSSARVDWVFGKLEDQDDEIFSAALDAIVQYGGETSADRLRSIAGHKLDPRRIVALQDAADFITPPSFAGGYPLRP